MAKTNANVPLPFVFVAKHLHLLVPLTFLSLIMVLVVPLPTPVMDVLLSVNISLAAIILLTTIYMKSPLEFSAFPALLLSTTLFRLVLNVATTRLILSADATTPAEATAVAGHVIEAFAGFVAGDSVIVGVIIFIILVVVQFVVITKGATRMSEVAARFTLDAMPGKQMAIDADLSAGLIDETTARVRREAITSEADFYGAMDGASKFVRGDAIAGIIITIVNIVGGFATGIFVKGWTMGESLEVFTRLTIGDGLVSQVPSFIIAIAAGLIVARTNDKTTIGEEIPRQLSSQPVALYLISGFLCVLAFTPLPSIPLFGSAFIVGAVAWSMRKVKQNEKANVEAEARAEAAQKPRSEQPVEDLLSVDTMEIEIGYGLIAMVDTSRGGDLLDRIAMIRRQVAVELGIVVPPIRIRDNMQLEANMYRIKLRNAIIGEGVVYPDLLMAMDSGLATEKVDGIAGREPAFDLEAIWIDKELKQKAETSNYTVVDATSVLATHLTELIKRHADELLSREEVNHLLEQLRKTSPKLVEEAIPGMIKVNELQKVLQHLLRERIPVRDLETIVETLSDWATHTKDIDVLIEYVRNSLRRTISSIYAESDELGKSRLHCVTLDPVVEDVINGFIERGPSGTSMSIPPHVANRIARAVTKTAESLVGQGHQLIVLTSPSVRAQVHQILENHVPNTVVLSYNEIVRDLEVESHGLVQLEQEENVPVHGAVRQTLPTPAI
ncbi:MAG: flagellar biosynthesis protein FlhA [Planctomycetota bacterium]|nr:flagellar biosynthesis protein FlhA [Planctomycetota bacterium]